jgi:pSer/pThr/pTyr-binding forkhead associated (FHA) protein
MFSVEIDFHDGVSAPETVMVRRPVFTIGGSDSASVSVEEMRQLQYDLQITREVGRRFKCTPLPVSAQVQVPQILEGTFEGSTSVNLGNITLQITSLDMDLMFRDGESPDRAGVRIVRQASYNAAPKFPALFFPGKSPFTVSFVPDQAIIIGRSKECNVRLEVGDVSGRHARVGYESGQFWIEDLGSTNGTFVNQQQVSGRAPFAPGVPVQIGKETAFFGVNSDEQLKALSRSRDERPRTIVPERRYPVLLSLSEVVRPARMVVPVGATIHVGRDPKSEIWLGAPHISRQHCEVTLSKTGVLTVTDCSTNGTSYDGGLLQKGGSFELDGKPRVLDFGGAVTLAICFSAEDEQIFIDSVGSVSAFTSQAPQEVLPGYEPRSVERRPTSSPSRAYRPPEPKATKQLMIKELFSLFSGLSWAKKLLVAIWLLAASVVVTIVASLIVGLFS